MSQPPASKLDYRGPGEPREPDPDAPRRFWLGLFGGMAASALAYFGGFLLFPGAIWMLAIAIALLKFGVGLVAMLEPGRRAFGAGILASLPIGVMIFFGSCWVIRASF